MSITETLLARYRLHCHFKTMEMLSKLISTGVNRRQVLLGSAALSCVGLPVAAKNTPRLPSASQQVVSSHSSLRLLANGKAVKSGVYQAGIAVQMKLGFKTYWRHPGDSGVPPIFNFEGSQNLASAEVLYPAPKKFADGAGGHSFGYDASEIVFPVLITAIDVTKPINLRLKADYAVCESICIPATGETSLLVSEALDDLHVSRLATAHAGIPERLKIGQGNALRIVAFKKAESPENFIVDVQIPSGLNAELFLEGESPWFFETKGFTRHDADRGSYLVAVIERSKAADCTGAEVILTLVAEKFSIEVATRLDLALVTH